MESHLFIYIAITPGGGREILIPCYTPHPPTHNKKTRSYQRVINISIDALTIPTVIPACYRGNSLLIAIRVTMKTLQTYICSNPLHPVSQFARYA